MPSTHWSRLRPGARGVVVAFLLSGALHLVRPQVYEPLVPPRLPAATAWVRGTGVAEIASAVGLLAGQRWGPPAAAATLATVWPGNWWHALSTQRDPQAPVALKVGLWLRLPLQVPMIRAALDPYAGRATGGVRTAP